MTQHASNEGYPPGPDPFRFFIRAEASSTAADDREMEWCPPGSPGDRVLTETGSYRRQGVALSAGCIRVLTTGGIRRHLGLEMPLAVLPGCFSCKPFEGAGEVRLVVEARI